MFRELGTIQKELGNFKKISSCVWKMLGNVEKMSEHVENFLGKSKPKN
jgi:hypothetical protein